MKIGFGVLNTKIGAKCFMKLTPGKVGMHEIFNMALGNANELKFIKEYNLEQFLGDLKIKICRY